MDTKQKTRQRAPQQGSRSNQTARSGTKRPAQDATRRAPAAKRPPVRTSKKRKKVDFGSIFKPAPVAERSAQRSQERKKQAARRRKAPAVIYTQPKPLNLARLALQLTVVLAVVLAVVMGMSVFFKVKNVMVYGNHAYSAWTIREASGIEEGANLLSFGRIRANGRIKAELPYVEKVRIGINLPDTVNIYIEEIDVAYAIQTTDGTWWLMSSSGQMMEQIDAGTAGAYTKVLGVELDSPAIGEQAVAAEEQEETTAPTEDTIPDATMVAPVTVTARDRLYAALQILASLEINEIVGEVASVDVSDLTNIQLWYGQRFQVKLGDTSNVDKKISWMGTAVAQMNEYETGELDVSFVHWPDEVGYTPFT